MSRFDVVWECLDDSTEFADNKEETTFGVSEVCDRLNELATRCSRLEEENEQLKQFPVKLDNRIQELEESLKALKEMETDDLNPQAVEDVATLISISLNALLEFRKELNGDVE